MNRGRRGTGQDSSRRRRAASKTVAQSFLILTTVAARSASACSSACSAPARVVELSLCVVMQKEEPQRRAVGVRSGRRPIWFQIRTGFSGPSAITRTGWRHCRWCSMRLTYIMIVWGARRRRMSSVVIDSVSARGWGQHAGYVSRP